MSIFRRLGGLGGGGSVRNRGKVTREHGQFSYKRRREGRASELPVLPFLRTATSPNVELKQSNHVYFIDFKRPQNGGA